MATDAPWRTARHPYESVPLIVISGVGRSGTTALRESLGLHPDVHSTGRENNIIYDVADTALAAIDSAVAHAVKERGLGTWVGSAAVARAARMNPTYAPDPHALPLAMLAPAERRPDIPIEDPLASQLRTLAALSDARFLLLPLQLRFDARQQDGKTTGERAVLELALIDARLAQLLWRGSVSSDVAAAFSLALVTQAATRVPDLVVTR